MDINSLREPRASSELSVSELNSYIKNIFDNDRTLSAVSVKGEISNFTNHRSGHLYFSLKDEGGQVKAVMFRSSASKLRFQPENGMKVIVRCSVSVYPQTGAYQLYVTSMQPDGIGALYLAYEQLKAKLEAQGLFSYEYKKEIPSAPSSIGVITSPTGAAIRDIINILNRRYPVAKVYLYPALVQGEQAEADLIKGIDYFDKSGLVDVIIIGRGGGSIEDLWAFNGELLAKRIFQCEIPVISAVGHETDFTICDFVADLRAPTPSAAAELAVPDRTELLLKLDGMLDYCTDLLERKLERLEQRYMRLLESEALRHPLFVIEDLEDNLFRLEERARELAVRRLEEKESCLKLIAGKLDSLSPLAVLSRGYSVVYGKGAVIKSINDVSQGEQIRIRVSDGCLSAEIKEKGEINGQ